MKPERKLGLGHFLVSLDSQIKSHEEAIDRLKKMREQLRRVMGGEVKQLPDVDSEDREELRLFIHDKFVSKYATVDEALDIFRKDPELWASLIKPRLYTAIRPPVIKSEIKRQYAAKERES
jgi:hypothetical protein